MQEAAEQDADSSERQEEEMHYSCEEENAEEEKRSMEVLTDPYSVVFQF